MGRIYQRGQTYWVQYRYRGRLFRESTGSSKEPAAVKLLKRRLGEIGQGRLVGPDLERTSFEDLGAMLVDDYIVHERKSLDRAELSIRHLKGFFAQARAVEITSDRISAYIRSRLDHAKPGTIRLELAALKRMFALGMLAGKVASRPLFPSLAVSNARTGFFEEPELKAVLAELPGHVRPLVLFLSWTGWRSNEAKSLRWTQVDLAGGVVRLEAGSTKSGASRVFPFAALPELAALIREQREWTSQVERESGVLCPWVFHRDGKPILSFRGAWKLACKRAGVHGRLVHDLRRTAARSLIRAGVSEGVVMKLCGWTTRAMLDRYNITSVTDLEDGLRRLAAHKLATPVEQRRVMPIAVSSSAENEHTLSTKRG